MKKFLLRIDDNLDFEIEQYLLTRDISKNKFILKAINRFLRKNKKQR